MLVVLVLFFLATLDRLAKVASLQGTLPTISPLGEVVNFFGTANPNGVLSLPLSSLSLLVLTFLVGVFLLVLITKEKNRLNRFLFAMIALGVFSNGYDRLMYGFVVDTFRFLNTLSFNLADCFIVVGFLVVAIRFRKTELAR